MTGRWLACVAAIGAVAVQAVFGASVDDELHKQISYEFIPDVVVSLKFVPTPNANVTLTGRGAKTCDNPVVVKDSDSVGNLGIVLTNEGQGCLANADYSNGDYSVRVGLAEAGGFSFVAYEVSAPASKATKFVASGQELYVKPSTIENLVILQLSDGAPMRLATVAVAAELVGTFRPTGVKIESLKNTVVYLVAGVSQKLPTLTRNVVRATAATLCQNAVADAAIVGDLAVVTAKYSDKCWTDGRYNSDQVLVELGKLKGSDGSEHKGYRISPPAVKATQFVGSKLSLRLRTSTGEIDIVVPRWLDPVTASIQLGAKLELPGDGQFLDLGRSADDFDGPMVLLTGEPETRLSVWPLVSDSVEGAWLAGGAAAGGHSLTARRFILAAGQRPFDPSVDWKEGPGAHGGNYGTHKRFFRVARANGDEGTVWQDTVSLLIYISWFAPDLKSFSTTAAVATPRQVYLVAAAGDAAENVMLLLIDKATPATKTTQNVVTLTKVTSSGAIVKDVQLDGLNVYTFFSSGASMVWSANRSHCGMILSRTMTQGTDGLNHQGAIAVVVNTESLQVVKNWGQTSGHSFGNSLILDSSGDFLGMDLGDNYPRGVNVHKFSSTKKQSRLVYAFKTLHGKSPQSPAKASYAEYTEISTNTTKFYKWSNDNNVYTELAHAGVVEVDDGLLVFFAGERRPLDNAQTGKIMNVPRNVAFIKVPKDLASKDVLSAGAVETGGFYTFGGQWSVQTNKGIVFLTEYVEMNQAVTRLKTARLAPNKILLLWERWSEREYQDSQWMVVRDDGSKVSGPTGLGYGLRLPHQDDLHVVRGRIVMYSGTSDGNLVRLELCVDDGCKTSPPAPPTKPPQPGQGEHPSAGGGSGGGQSGGGTTGGGTSGGGTGGSDKDGSGADGSDPGGGAGNLEGPTRGGLGGGLIFLIVLLILGALGAAIYFGLQYQKKRTHLIHHPDVSAHGETEMMQDVGQVDWMADKRP